MICNREYSIIGFLILVQFLQEVWATATFRLYRFPSRLLLRRKQTSGNTCSLFSVSVLGRKHAKKSNNWDMPGASLQCHCSDSHSWWLVPGTKTRNLEFIIILPTIPSSAGKFTQLFVKNSTWRTVKITSQMADPLGAKGNQSMFCFPCLLHISFQYHWQKRRTIFFTACQQTCWRKSKQQVKAVSSQLYWNIINLQT